MTGAVSIQKAGRSTTCAGRSLSSAQGSVSVPIVNGPAGTSTSAAAGAAAGAGGGGACSTGAPARSWCVASIVSSCCCSCCTIIPKAKPCSTSRLPRSGLVSSASSAFSRTSATYARASAGPSSGSSTRLARECWKAS